MRKHTSKISRLGASPGFFSVNRIDAGAAWREFHASEEVANESYADDKTATKNWHDVCLKRSLSEIKAATSLRRIDHDDQTSKPLGQNQVRHVGLARRLAAADYLDLTLLPRLRFLIRR